MGITLEFISQVIMGIGIALLAGLLTGYMSSSIGILGYVVAGGIFAFGLILFVFVKKSEDQTPETLSE